MIKEELSCFSVGITNALAVISISLSLRDNILSSPIIAQNSSGVISFLRLEVDFYPSS